MATAAMPPMPQAASNSVSRGVSNVIALRNWNLSPPLLWEEWREKEGEGGKEGEEKLAHSYSLRRHNHSRSLNHATTTPPLHSHRPTQQKRSLHTVKSWSLAWGHTNIVSSGMAGGAGGGGGGSGRGCMGCDRWQGDGGSGHAFYLHCCCAITTVV